MKKFLALLLALAMCLSLAACSGGSNTAETPADNAADSDAAADNAADSDAAADNTASEEPLTIQDVWPEGTTVYFDVAAKAGGGTDLYTRYLTQALTEVCPGVNFVVTNYDTAEVGAEHAKNADPDGLTLTTVACTSMDNYLSGASNVNPYEDYTIVGKMIDGGPQAIIASPDAPYHNLEELGAYIQEHPGEVVVGCALGGTSQVILYNIIDSLGEGLADSVTYVQCASEADKLTQTASKAIDIANCSIPNAQAYEADGKLTILGTIGPEVATLENMSELVGLELPETFATTVEQGIDFSWDAGYYIAVPAGTPDNICQAINSVLSQMSENEDFAAGMKTMASYANTPDLETSRADWTAEWEAQQQYMSDLGLNVRS